MSLITISESIGCGGKAIAALVAKELKLELYDDRRLEEEAIQLGVQPEALKDLDEKAPGLFSRIFSDKPQVYLDLLQGVVYEVAKRGQGIILGHGSQVLLRDFGCALHVRIYGSESSRIEYLMKGRGLSREATEKLIHKTDNEQRGFLQFAFHMNWNDPSLYDLVINRDKLSTDLAAKLIIEAARSQEIKECSMTALESMERLSLSRRVDAALLESNLSRDVFSRDMFHIEVPEKGVVHITGATHMQRAEERLLKVVKGVPGVTKVRSEVVVMPPGIE
jgi:cytidylate kinase